MGKHYSIEFKHRIVKLILEVHQGIREVTEQFCIGSHFSIVVWLQCFENTVLMSYIVNISNREKQK